MLEKFGLIGCQSSVARVGETYGRLTILEIGKKRNPSGKFFTFAICKCSCGSYPKPTRLSHLADGTATSCGCYQRERVTTHGMYQSPHYGRWSLMLDRCENPKSGSFKNYGGRGIKVCDRWHDVKNYIDDLPEGYFEGAELDRIDNDGDYEPGNVRWATALTNNGNRRYSRSITFNGKTQNLMRWSEDVGVAYRTLRYRLQNGMAIEQALTTPTLTPKESGIAARKSQLEGKTLKGRAPAKTSRRIHKIEFNGETVTTAQLSEIYGVSGKTIHRRIFELGWPVERAIIK